MFDPFFSTYIGRNLTLNDYNYSVEVPIMLTVFNTMGDDNKFSSLHVNITFSIKNVSRDKWIYLNLYLFVFFFIPIAKPKSWLSIFFAIENLLREYQWFAKKVLRKISQIHWRNGAGAVYIVGYIYIYIYIYIFKSLMLYIELYCLYKIFFTTKISL